MVDFISHKSAIIHVFKQTEMFEQLLAFADCTAFMAAFANDTITLELVSGRIKPQLCYQQFIRNIILFCFKY